MKNMEERIEALERSSRRYRTFTAILLLSLIAVALLAAKSSSDKILTRDLHIEDANGKVRMRLFVSDDGPAIFFANENGKLRMMLAGFDKESGILMYDTQGKRRLDMQASDKGSHILLADAKEIPRARLETMEVNRGAPSFSLFDSQGIARIMLDVFKDKAGLIIFDNEGSEKAKLP